ncbi:GNAT family N-acetyltransferase [Cellulomonas chengniuliangii]|uniref:GNAT family N-acetyltransferase n=1 Tax=Cellulomonas chengniuliangii TaxID=2968084 RepID=A0ABY5L0V8_9CELL|nr:GNAT family protein [Cellulomonas chengniuliangii]MCC2307681.1 GNAT family N-acetyltransferase [Cellulomonas chengniuliangii]MCC2318787.1 GNAT family N-acetyltransferase [Cellulomonas chengniuliangii]UUI75558.1 GNAT family N-acetyltransferase [Cellulomonas chengniuliangii]
MSTPAPTAEPDRPATAPDGRDLAGPVVELRLLSADDAPALFRALDDARVWASGYSGGPGNRPPNIGGAERWISRMLTVPGLTPYGVRTVEASELGPAGTLVGTSALGDVDLPNRRLHLGWTAYTPDAWSGLVNPASKLLLLRHAFVDCGMHRVKLQTDAINLRSQAAIARLGAVREGVLRQHVRRADGTWRDTVVYSILADEWPRVEARLEARIAD